MSADRVSTQNRIVAQEFRLVERSLSTLLPLGSKVGPLGGLRSRPSDGSPPLPRPHRPLPRRTGSRETPTSSDAKTPAWPAPGPRGAIPGPPTAPPAPKAEAPRPPTHGPAPPPPPPGELPESLPPLAPSLPLPQLPPAAFLHGDEPGCEASPQRKPRPGHPRQRAVRPPSAPLTLAHPGWAPRLP